MVFVEVSRPRVWVIGIHNETCGGQQALEWAESNIKEMIDFRGSLPATPLWSVVDPERRNEKAWRQAMRDCLSFIV